MQTSPVAPATSKTVCFAVVEVARELVSAGLLERQDLHTAASHLISSLQSSFVQALASLPQLKAAQDVTPPTAEGRSLDEPGLDQWWRENSPQLAPGFEAVQREAAALVARVQGAEVPAQDAAGTVSPRDPAEVERARRFVIAYALQHQGQGDRPLRAEGLAQSLAVLAAARPQHTARAGLGHTSSSAAAPRRAGAPALVAYLGEPRRRLTTPLTEAQLDDLVGEMPGVHGTSADADGVPLRSCVDLLRELERRLHPGRFTQGTKGRSGPSGVRVPRTMDDFALGSGRVEDSLALGHGWNHVGSSWRPLLETVRQTGVGTTALILVRRPGGRIGHALALHHTVEGVRWVEPQSTSGTYVLSETPERFVAEYGRVVLIDSAGEVVPWKPAAGRGTTYAVAVLTDAPTDRRYGAAETEHGPKAEPRHAVHEAADALAGADVVAGPAVRPGGHQDAIRLAPPRITVSHRLAASDLLVSLRQGETKIVEAITDALSTAFGNDLPATHTIVDQVFSAETLRPLLSLLTRGERWTTDISGGGWSGQVGVRVELGALRHRPGRPVEIEFEGGSSHQRVLEGVTDRRRRLQGGLQGKFDFADWNLTAIFSALSEHLQGARTLDGGAFIARHKTKEPAALFDTELAITIDVGDLSRRGRNFVLAGGGRSITVPGVEVTVAVPERETVDAAGRRPEFRENLLAPRHLQDGRFALSDIVTDVRSASPVSADAVGDLLSGLDGPGRSFYGPPQWGMVREKLSEELSLRTLHQSLKGMTTGQPLTVEIFDSGGEVTATVEISARVTSTVQSGETKQSEFNVGTAVVRSHAREDIRSGALQVPAPLQFAVPSLGGTVLNAGGGAAVQLGRDRGELSRTVFETGTTTKTKVPGVLFDGVADLRFALHKATPEPGRPETAAAEGARLPYREAGGSLAFTVLVERGDARAEHADAVVPDPTVRADGRPGPLRTRWTPGTELHGPPPRVWSRLSDGGLHDGVVVRDLPDLAPLRDRVDQLGRRAVGQKRWSEKRAETLAVFDQSNLAARLGWMTRGYPLRGPDVDGVVLTATARVLHMEFRRFEEKSELSTINESTTSTASQRLWSDALLTQGAGGFTAPLDGAGDSLSLSGQRADQVRHRQGTQHGVSNRLVSNGKGASRRVILGALTEIMVGAPDGDSERIEVPVEISMDARESWLYVVGGDGLAVFTEASVGRRQRPEPAATGIALPERFTERGAMSASDVLRGTGPEVVHVLQTVEREIEKRYGQIPYETRRRLEARLDPFALRAELSQLTRGGTVRTTVSVGGKRLAVHVSARLKNDFQRIRTLPAFEFEFASQQRASSGASQDFWHRKTVGATSRFKVPHVDVTVGRHRIWDRSRGFSSSSTARELSGAKTVEDAHLLRGTAAFHIVIHEEAQVGSSKIVPADVDVPLEVAIPQRDSEPVVSDHIPRRDWPRRIAKSMRLSDSDVVTDAYLPATATGSDVEARAAISPLEEAGARELGGDWPGMREKIRRTLLDRDLAAKLKPMMAGQEIVLRHGRSTVRISAHVESLRYANRTGATEFNSGVGMQRVLASTDGSAMEGRGVGGTATAGALVTVPVAGVAPVVGGNATISWGNDRQDREARSAASGVSVKAKHQATSYVGEASLTVRMERAPLVPLGSQDRVLPEPGIRKSAGREEGRRPGPSLSFVRSTGAWGALRRVGTPSRAVARTTIGFSALVETPATPSTDQLQAPVEVRVPPSRVWDPAEGLRDTDVVRWLGDSSGVKDILREVGPAALGSRNWKQIRDLAERTLDQPRLATHLNLRSADSLLSTPQARRRLPGAEVGVHARLRLVRLQYVDTDTAAELSPANEASAVRTKTQLHWNSRAGQAQFGAKIEGADASLLGFAGMERRSRQGASLADGGAVVSHGKIPTPMARYEGHAKVSVTFVGPSGNRTEHGLIPVEISIPLDETTALTVESDARPVFGPQSPDLAAPADSHEQGYREQEAPGTASVPSGSPVPEIRPAEPDTGDPRTIRTKVDVSRALAQALEQGTRRDGEAVSGTSTEDVSTRLTRSIMSRLTDLKLSVESADIQVTDLGTADVATVVKVVSAAAVALESNVVLHVAGNEIRICP
ncbi:toxin glutamine deamidase domain-containing protein [Streptomyces sp. NPDC090080]|uniref:toxin glutamine deamidase domain-containing protein n=1 Tax=Streptomyces sp. NPDC090080 TaxID=3365939 RepID=UPI003823C420